MKHSSPLSVAVLSLLMSMVSRAGASPPSAANSTVPRLIRLVGASGGVPDAAAGQFTIVARDLANNLMNGVAIVLDLSNCPDLEICSDQLDPTAVTNCAAKTIQKLTNIQGQATFTVLGSSTGSGHASSLAGSARVFGRGVLLALPSVASFDLDGSGGVGAGDLSVWLSDFGSGVAYQRSDFDGDGSIGAVDLSEWLGVFGAGTSTQSCGASCP
jgi:hypothetical protein